ncbi:MAG: carbohydrate binding domain-containing protein [Isosphaeraceae bacterium]
MRRIGTVIIGSLLFFCHSAQAGEEGLFPFVVTYDAPANVTNVSAWLDRPAGAHGYIRAEEERLRNDTGPMRFWATNICFEGCFPTHQQAERLAARLARLGINCVRMHHMDNFSIWGNSPNKLTIDPRKLERLDYLIDQLRKHGVYTNLNLHVSRWFDEAEGFSGRAQRPQFDKGLDNFEPRMIEFQKKYARDLLTHVNPYTGHAYTREPAIAFVEINNENALHAIWGEGRIDTLPEPYAGTFQSLWNAWLKKKYGSTDRLTKAWNAEAVPIGRELLRNGQFQTAPHSSWNLERDDDAQAQWSVQPNGPAGKPCLRVVVNKRGSVSWHPQFSQGGLALRKDTPYTLSFRMRAADKARIQLNAMQAHEPWAQLGFSAEARLGSEWKQFRFTFTVEQDDSNARITWTNLLPGTYELADVSLRPGGVLGVGPKERLEDATIPVMKKGSMNLTRTARHDFMDFLWDTEAHYWWGMYRFLKDDLHVTSLVTGTQMGYSPPHIQSHLDYVDGHSYWHHPTFPGRPWDSRNWYVEDTALVNEPGGTLARLASTRVAGKPYTVSEYNHPAPLSFAAEGFPMIAAFGAFQGWSAIYSFDYTGNNHYEPDKLDGYFDIKSDPSRLVHMPACVALFVRGDVSPALHTLLAPMPREAERRQLQQSQSAWTLTTDRFGLDDKWSLLHAIGLDLKAGKMTAPRKPLPSTRTFVSDTGQIRWDISQRGAGTFMVNTPRTKLFTGFIHGRTFKLGNVSLDIGSTRLNWATISLTVIEGKGFDGPCRILIAATGLVQNKGARLQHLEGSRITLGNRWGESPVLCEGIPAKIVLPDSAERSTLYPLDAAGNRRRAIKPAAAGDRSVITLKPEYQTLWYELEVR